MMMRKILATCAALLALAACEDDPIRTEPVASGSATFNIPTMGSRPAASFSASGAVELDSAGNWKLGNWAYAEIASTTRWPLRALASMPAGDGSYNYLQMKLARDAQAGAVLTVKDFCGQSELTCAEFGVLVGLASEVGTPLGGCSASSGTVRITARNSRRIAGTLTVPVMCGMYTGNTATTAGTVEGSFDLPLVDVSQYIPANG